MPGGAACNFPGENELILAIVAAEFLRERLVPPRFTSFPQLSGSEVQAHFQVVQQESDSIPFLNNGDGNIYS